jgi:hypothetical protein
MSKQSEPNGVLNNLRQQMEGWEREGYDVSELKMLLLSVDSRSSSKPSRKLLWLYILIPVVIVAIALGVWFAVAPPWSSSSTNPDAPAYCAIGCQWAWVDDGTCDSSLGCDVAECYWDGGDCYSSQSDFCATDCQVSFISDGECDIACYVAACNYDGGDCDYCAGDCAWSYVGNGVCDSACNNAACQYDGGDCR